MPCLHAIHPQRRWHHELHRTKDKTGMAPLATNGRNTHTCWTPLQVELYERKRLHAGSRRPCSYKVQPAFRPQKLCRSCRACLLPHNAPARSRATEPAKPGPLLQRAQQGISMSQNQTIQQKCSYTDHCPVYPSGLMPASAAAASAGAWCQTPGCSTTAALGTAPLCFGLGQKLTPRYCCCSCC